MATDEDIPTGHGLEDEPWLRRRPAEPGARDPDPDPDEELAADTLEREAAQGGGEGLEALHSVFEESHHVHEAPGERGAERIARAAHCARCGAELQGERRDAPCPACGHRAPRRWREWYLARRASVGVESTWIVILGVALLGGPLAVLGAFVSGWSAGGGGSAFGLWGAVVFAPALEEVLKVGLLTFLVETRPYLLRSALSIRGAALASAASFAAIENLLYVFVYLDDPSDSLVLWRWTVCVALHVVATQIAAEGVVRIWRPVHERCERPSLQRGFGWLVAAMVLHGGYNLTVTLLEMGGFSF